MTIVRKPRGEPELRVGEEAAQPVHGFIGHDRPERVADNDPRVILNEVEHAGCPERESNRLTG